jgi:site-specific recombinase XerD
MDKVFFQATPPGLEHWFRQRRTLVDFRRGPLGDHFDGFSRVLASKGYSRWQGRRILAVGCQFNVFLLGRGISKLADVSDSLIEPFLDQHLHKAQAVRDPHEQRVSARGYLQALFRYLAATKALVPPACEPITTPYGWILGPYLKHLHSDDETGPQTAQRIAAHVTAFLAALRERAHPRRFHAVGPETVEAYIQQYLKEGRRDLFAFSSSLRRFFHYCAVHGHTRSDFSALIPPVRQCRHAGLPKGAPDTVIRRLLGAVHRETPIGARNYAILLLLIAYGIRGISVAGLLIEDINWQNSRITFRARKGGKTVIMPLLKPVGDAIIRWLRVRPSQTPHREVFLRVPAPHRPLGGIAISGIVRGYMAKIGFSLSRGGTRTLRHSWAIRALAHDCSIKAIADVLGHRHIDTAFIYAKVDFKALRTVAMPWPQGS